MAHFFVTCKSFLASFGMYWNCTDPALCSIYFFILNIHPFLMSKSIFIILIMSVIDTYIYVAVVPSSAYHCPLQ